MVRRIIEIDKQKCNGCGICADACHEGAIGMINGKAELLRDDYCDGLGDCLPTCPTGAITFVEREAAAYDEAAVKANMAKKAAHGGCPGSVSQQILHDVNPHPSVDQSSGTAPESHLSNWPVQIKLAPVKASYFDNAHLLIAADCAAYAYGNFHSEFIRGKVALIGCPKLDAVDYSEKLTDIIRSNDIKSVTIVRMEVPCCGGIQNAAVTALKDSGKFIPWQIVTISIDGNILDQ